MMKSYLTNVGSVYIKPEDMESYEEEDSRKAIQDILDSGNRVFLSNATYYISDSIILDNDSWIEGIGQDSTIRLKPHIEKINSRFNAGIKLKNSEVTRCTLLNFSFYGDIKKQSGVSYDGIHIENSTANSGGEHRIEHLWIYECTNDGFYLKGGGDSFISNINVRWANKNGIELNTFDNRFMFLDAGSIGKNGIDITGANNKFINCKGWWTQGYGIFIQGSRNILTACEAQDCLSGGFFIAGSSNNIQGIIDGVGERGPSMKKDNVPAIIIGITNSFNYTDSLVANFIVTDRMEYYPNQGTTDYLIDIQGENSIRHITYNDITVSFLNVKKGIFKNKDQSNTSSYKITGLLGEYGKEKQSININSSGVVDGNVTNGLILELIESKLKKANNMVYIRYNIKPLAISYGTEIGTVSENCIPIFSIDIQGRCYDENGIFLDLCICNIAEITGKITIYEVPVNTKQILLGGQYMASY